jgi:hypothetical protein
MYFAGNEIIHQLTKGRISHLYVSIMLQDDTEFYELYEQFSIANEADKYRLFLGGPATGTLGSASILEDANENEKKNIHVHEKNSSLADLPFCI